MSITLMERVSVDPGFPDPELDLVVAKSLVDVSEVADPRPLIADEPGLLIRGWNEDVEVVALKSHDEVVAAAAVRSHESDDGLDVFVIGAWRDKEPDSPQRTLLRKVIRERIDARRAQKEAQKDGVSVHVPATVHWGAIPPSVEVQPEDPEVGVQAFDALKAHREAVAASFMEDLRRPYGPLTF